MLEERRESPLYPIQRRVYTKLNSPFGGGFRVSLTHPLGCFLQLCDRDAQDICKVTHFLFYSGNN